VIHPTFLSDEAKFTSADSHKGCVISLTNSDEHIDLPLMSSTGFSQFTFILLEGNGNVRLSLKYVLLAADFLVISNVLTCCTSTTFAN